MPLNVEADLPDPEPSGSLDTLLENHAREHGSGDASPVPKQIGRYRTERVLGKGGFGLVFLAYDEKLERHVAVKVPHVNMVSRPEDAEAYLKEARTVASLDHPHIVAVHDVGSTEQFPCYVVSKYIDGMDLAARLKQSRFSINDAVGLVATVAEALHYANKRGLVHRDIKPGNILIDKNGTAFVVDFGLALREQDVGQGPRYAGTPAYMSPEQARGEGHRVDGRSDIFSLAVVLYELLVGRRPFTGDSSVELLENIIEQEPKPPRQIDDNIPKELDRICLKAMSKRASERYSTAKDLADDLRHFLSEYSDSTTSFATPSIAPSAQPPSTMKGADTPSNLPSDSRPIKIVPKGLRSFDAEDADFFLELLPGPRDRDGLPDSLRFWKTRVEETDADNTFAVGLIYGPSGCGKSSLIKAGLLPRLSQNVIAVYVEATAEETEPRLLNGLRKQCPALPTNESLKKTLAVLRRGHGVPSNKKVVIVLDQFEQWLHAKRKEQNTELVQALRQCDGGRLQCVVMVRDDFWLAISRFAEELEVDFVPGHNIALADLFDVDHAKKVLGAFGRAYGRLPEGRGETTTDQKEFLNQAVSGLAQEAKVNSVRLALFAEMMKSREWIPATLKAVGGTEGVGVRFLEETFSTPGANPRHRRHQVAAQAVLKALLPESGMDIKGHMQSNSKLLEVSGYADQPRNFEALLRILNSEIRLVTPTDPEGRDNGDSSAVQSGAKYYQLTHDYLVPSLRDWLTRKKKETLPGRSELLLEDCAAVWNARPENRQLPSFIQCLQIYWWTNKKNWTPTQRKMMCTAARYQAVRGSVVALLLVVAMFASYKAVEQHHAMQAAGFVDSLMIADIAQVPNVIADLSAFRPWVNPLLRTRFAMESDAPVKLRLALALLPVDDSQVDYLSGRLPLCSLDELRVVRTALAPSKGKLNEPLWQVVRDESRNDPERFQAAAVLAEYAADDERWHKAAPYVAQYFTSFVTPEYRAQWRQLFQSVKNRLTSPLTGILTERTHSEKQREAAAFLLSDYLRDQPEKLAEVILVADELAEFTPLIEGLKPHSAVVEQILLREMRAAMPAHLAKSNDELTKTSENLSDTDQQQQEAYRSQRDAHWKRQSLAAVTLVQLGFGENVWPLLKFTSDPSLRSFVIHYIGKLGTDYYTLLAALRTETDVSIRRAFIQCLGALDSTRIRPADRSQIVEQLTLLYRDDPDPGIHGSALWSLRQWREKLPELKIGGAHRWYINSQGQTMVVIDPEHEGNKKIGNHFAISSHEVTVAEFSKFRVRHGGDRNVAATDDSPVNQIAWYDAVAYCNWLSEQEGFPEDQWVYQRNDDNEYAGQMTIKESASSLLGYRLPMEAEWELACRAGTSGWFGFGEPNALLKHYGWYAANSSGRSHSVESLLPNELGLFDMHGNVWEWTQNPNSGPSTPINDGSARVVRSGSFANQLLTVRSANTSSLPPLTRSVSLGFRVAKTMVPVASAILPSASEEARN